jgi:hypothetical protein
MDRRTARSALAALHDAQNRMYAGGDVEPLRALLSRDIEWHVPGETRSPASIAASRRSSAIFGTGENSPQIRFASILGRFSLETVITSPF